MATTQESELATRRVRTEPERQLPPGPGEGSVPSSGLVGLLRDLAEDTRILVQQEIQLAKVEATRTGKRLVVDSAWIGAGALVLAVGGLCLVIALALGLGALLGSYWLGTLITGGILFLVGALMAWKGVRDLKSGGFAPTATVETLQEDRDWAKREADDFKRGIQKG